MKTKKDNSVIVEIMNVIDGTSTNVQGYTLFVALDKLMAGDKKIKLSLKDCTPMSSSFLSSSIGALYDKYGVAKIKSNLSLINFMPSRAESIKTYLKDLQKYVK